ncbi:MAG: potassium channel family protein [Patescibacteria group bacterium]|nr:potassium channel family protein [Patescibacteria group bacterium]
MDFKEAVSLIEQRGDFNQYAKLREVFENKLDELDRSDYTERGLCYYYLLLSLLKAHLVYDTEECREFYKKMEEEFLKQEDKYKEEPEKFSKIEINDFYHLMERCYSSLEIVYEKKDFVDSKKDAYERKMYYRKDRHWFNGHYWSWFEYKFLELTCLYGNNFMRWGVTAVVFATVLAGVYFLIDLSLEDASRTVSHETGHWFDYIYYSMVTLTSLGYGDIVPKVFPSKFLATTETFFGFVMLGIFITLIQRRISR